MKPLAIVIVAILCSVFIRETADVEWPKYANGLPAIDVNRSQKGDKLPIGKMDYRFSRPQPTRAPMETKPISSNKRRCASPVDVHGRCFARIPANALTT